ncbi:MAG: hypothetical protein LBJ92_01440 [Holosporales bacterium]|nr:hypothetical protein [Holosporales bacterium]
MKVLIKSLIVLNIINVAHCSETSDFCPMTPYRKGADMRIARLSDISKSTNRSIDLKAKTQYNHTISFTRNALTMSLSGGALGIILKCKWKNISIQLQICDEEPSISATDIILPLGCLVFAGIALPYITRAYSPSFDKHPGIGFQNDQAMIA